MGKKWSRDDVSMLRLYFATSTNEEMADMLGRTLRSVAHKASKMGLKKARAHKLAFMRDNAIMLNLPCRCA